MMTEAFEIHLVADLYPRVSVDGKLKIVHPITAAQNIGLKYRGSRVFPMSDMFVFYDCSNVPEELPDWLSVSKETRSLNEILAAS
jgi:hypothetical protein